MISIHGLANVELGVPVSPETVFRVGSMSKFFMHGMPHNRIEFVRDESGKVVHLLLKLPLLYPQRAVRID